MTSVRYRQVSLEDHAIQHQDACLGELYRMQGATASWLSEQAYKHQANAELTAQALLLKSNGQVGLTLQAGR